MPTPAKPRRPKGEGSISQRGSRFEVRVDLGRGPDGKRQRRTAYAPTREAAVTLLHTLLADRGRGTLVVSSRDTLGDYLESWLRNVVETSCEAQTYISYRATIRARLIPQLGHHPLDRLTLPHVQAAVRYWHAPGKGRQGYAPTTIRTTVGCLHAALERAVAEGLLTRNPAQGVRLPPLAPPKPKSLSVPEARRLLVAASAPDEWHGPLYALLLTTGLRIGELLALRWEDIDEDTGVLLIRRSFGKAIVGHAVKTTKTAAGIRRLPLIALHRAALDRQAAKWGAVEGWVFPGSGGLPLRYSTVRLNWQRFCTRHGLPAVTLHSLRHSCASLLVSLGVPINVVASILGHSRASITLDLYSHIMPGATREALEQLDTLLQGPPGD